MKALITGAGSGFGKYLSQKFPSATLVYKDLFDFDVLTDAFDIVIHCAADARHSFKTAELSEYVRSNLEVLEDALRVRAKYFVYMSSADVNEFTSLINEEITPYKLMKLIGEDLVRREREGWFLILRPTMLLGPTMRMNTTFDILVNRPRKFTLSEFSTFNYVHYDDLFQLILKAYELGLTETLNVSSTDSVRLIDLIDNYDFEFGQFLYRAPIVDSSKAYEIYPSLKKSSLEVIQKFKQELKAYEHSA